MKYLSILSQKGVNMLREYEKIAKKIIGTKIPKPISGTLSGHAAGEPFDKFLYQELKSKFPDNVFRNFEFLNTLYLNNPSAQTFEERNELFGSELISFLLNRGKSAVLNWSPTNLFTEKQNDTADILFTENNKFDIIDVKTRNMGIAGQPPNIISAFKLANAMKIMLNSCEFDNLDIIYVEIEWLLEDEYLIAKNVHVASLFKSNPKKLYINWAAAMQIQFHVSELDQSFIGSNKEWAEEYLTHYYYKALDRAMKMKTKFADPFESLIKK